jgi:DNA-binding transcriptional MerR regulator
VTVSDPNRPYLSIGEVLGLLLEEFPDVTISKIRFLESQGLIDPERTPSGYRKFYDADVERLRVILREQRENFLPLRVIRDRLENGQIEDNSGQLAVPRGIRNLPSDDDTGDIPAPPHEQVRTSNHPAARFTLVDPAPPPADTRQPAVVASLQEAPPSLVEVIGDSVSPGAQQYSAAELCRLADLSTAQLNELESFGLLPSRGRGANAMYNGHELAVATAAAGFLRHGVEGRHLRGWRQAADREVALFEQLVTPLLRQRNPQSRHLASDKLRELDSLGASLRQAIIASALANHFDV